MKNNDLFGILCLPAVPDHKILLIKNVVKLFSEQNIKNIIILMYACNFIDEEDKDEDIKCLFTMEIKELIKDYYNNDDNILFIYDNDLNSKNFNFIKKDDKEYIQRKQKIIEKYNLNTETISLFIFLGDTSGLDEETILNIKNCLSYLIFQDSETIIDINLDNSLHKAVSILPISEEPSENLYIINVLCTQLIDLLVIYDNFFYESVSIGMIKEIVFY
ncbi:MAG: hypothetical protein U1E31_00070 [Rickettsiales bacterium]